MRAARPGARGARAAAAGPSRVPTPLEPSRASVIEFPCPSAEKVNAMNRSVCQSVERVVLLLCLCAFLPHAAAGGAEVAPAPELPVAGAPAPEFPMAAAPAAVVVPAAHVAQGARSLPPGVAPEQGLQVKTILAARSVSAAFPQIRNAIGVRPDAKPWHPSGRAIDLMIPNPGSAEGIALGDSILAFVMDNAGRFGVQDVIWRGTYYTPGGGASGSGYGHYDHVHITTVGGGFPNGGEEYPAG